MSNPTSSCKDSGPQLEKETLESSCAGAARVTLRDIAQRLGISHTAVSLALRNHPSISPQRRLEVQRVAQEIGYHPDPLLSSLAAYRSRIRPTQIRSSLAWINQWSQPEQLRSLREFDAYWRGAAKAAERFGYRLDEIRWTRGASPRSYERILQTRNIRGVLIPPHEVAPDWGGLDWSEFSIVRFGMSVPSPHSHVVTADQQRATLLAMEKINQHGYQRIGLIVGADTERRLGGNFVSGFLTSQILYNVGKVIPPLLTDERLYLKEPATARAALKRWLVRHKPDALLTSLPQIPGMLSELGYRIPQDIAVAGTSINDVPVDAGIDQNPEAIGRVAVELLVSQINANERNLPAAPCRILVESRWRDGKTLPSLKDEIVGL